MYHGKFLYDMIVAEMRRCQDRPWPGFCIKMALPQATMFSLGPVNWRVVYMTVFSSAALDP